MDEKIKKKSETFKHTKDTLSQPNFQRSTQHTYWLLFPQIEMAPSHSYYIVHEHTFQNDSHIAASWWQHRSQVIVISHKTKLAVCS
jgi:hypothetical protein